MDKPTLTEGPPLQCNTDCHYRALVQWLCRSNVAHVANREKLEIRILVERTDKSLDRSV